MLDTRIATEPRRLWGLLHQRYVRTEDTAALAEFQSPTAAVLAEPLPASGRATIWVIAAGVAAAIAAMSLCAVDRVVSVSGKVVSQTPNMVLQPFETSIVRLINVREGQRVHAGDLIARLDPTAASADATASESEVASLQAEVDRLQAEASDRPYVGDGTAASRLQEANDFGRRAEQSAKLEALRQRIAGAEARVVQAESDVAGFTEQVTAARTKESIRRELEHLQIGSRLDALDAGSQRAELERNLQSAIGGRAQALDELKASIAERDATIDQFKRETLEQLTEAGRKLADAREQRTKAALRRRLVDMRADRNATILTVAHVSEGSVVQSGDEIVTLVPDNAPLEVEAAVPGRDAGFVEPGDPTTVKFDTFPYASHGTFGGNVLTVSCDSLTGDQIARTGSLRADAPQAGAGRSGLFYRASVSLADNRLRNLPAGFHMTPGMPVTVDIKVGRRTILAYLMSEVVPAFTEGLREP